jgi:hypothetical protein
MIAKYGAILAAIYTPSAYASTAALKCIDHDDTIKAIFPYSGSASHTITDMEYGTCTEADIGSAITIARTQNTDSGENTDFEITISVTKCGMATVNSTNYLHDGDFVVGSGPLTFRQFSLEARCWEEINLSFTYDTVESDSTSASSFEYTESGGTITIEFHIQAYRNDSFNEVITGADVPSQGGSMIYLGLGVKSANFNHRLRKYAPTDCTVKAVGTNLNYTLFDHSTTTSQCQNNDILFSLDYDMDSYVWRMQHILFLMGSTVKSAFELHCGVRMCDRRNTSPCDAVANACLSGQHKSDFLNQVITT